MSRTTVLIFGTLDRLRGPLESALRANGYRALYAVADGVPLEQQIKTLQADVALKYTDVPARQALESLAGQCPRPSVPVVLFCAADIPDSTDSAEQLRTAVQAGVSPYVIEAPTPAVLRSLIEVAIENFRGLKALHGKLNEARQALADRRVIDDAKCLLMERDGLREADAYRRLRRLAMNRGQRMAHLARTLLNASGGGGVGTDFGG
ncbi:MAG: ANTAR domain-containing protein [Nevskiales bacterium]|nr:ANTAR domain-containing protein [Nevskiales bacterium]